MTSSVDVIPLATDVSSETAFVDERDLARAAAHDNAAFDVLYRRYVTRIFRYIRSRVEREEDAMDLTQQTFLRAFDAIPRYHPSSAPFSAWLFRIAVNGLNDYRRRSKVSVSFDLLPASLHPVAEDSPDLDSLRRESIAELRALLESQGAYRRELLMLRFAAELTTREIAAVLQKPEATVKSDLRRTLKRLKGQLNVDG